MPEPIIGERLRTLRHRQGISQADLARALGASINAINMIECGQVKAPHIERLMALADLFDVSLDYLVGRTDDPTPAARKRRRRTDDDSPYVPTGAVLVGA
jgi:transcriptional regulator with XRE-family HTH domain